MMPAMSLATRCTACGTIFRVVQDQLRVSEGWVRCGRCAEVFDARQQLFDIEREAPPPWPSTPAPPALPTPPAPPPVHAPMRQDEHVHRVEAARVQEEEEEQSIEHFELPDELPAELQRHRLEDERTLPLHADAPDTGHREEPRWVDDDGPASAFPAPSAPEHTAPAPITVPADMGTDVVLSPNLQPRKKVKEKKPGAKLAASEHKLEKEDNKPAVPSFVRRAQAEERWRRPGVRAALGVVSALLVLLLGGQFALHSRDALAAQYPGAKPMLNTMCSVAGCEVQPWRHIEVLSVENTGLIQAGSGNQYQLSVSLLNKGSVPVAMPWIELSLSDSQGALLARRTISPQEFRTDKGAAPGTSIGGGADLNLQVLLATGEQRVSGYGVVLFYP